MNYDKRNGDICRVAIFNCSNIILVILIVYVHTSFNIFTAFIIFIFVVVLPTLRRIVRDASDGESPDAMSISAKKNTFKIRTKFSTLISRITHIQVKQSALKFT